ncbi:hypothetical protein GLOIN_2v1573512, partial [Rhizophagus irregularis DAOM 181602=DAOM 197198]
MPQRFRNWDFIRGNQKFLITEITGIIYMNRVMVWLFWSFWTWNSLDSFVTPWMDLNFV